MAFVNLTHKQIYYRRLGWSRDDDGQLTGASLSDGLFVLTTVGDLRKMIEELPDGLELLPNGIGNLAIYRPADPPLYRFYVGYIDLALNGVHMLAGSQGEKPWERAPGYLENAFGSPTSPTASTTVYESDHETNQVKMEPDDGEA